MARKKVIKEITLKSWDDVNEVLRKIAEKQSFIEAKVSKYNEAEAKRRKALDGLVNPVKADIGDMEEDLRLFCEDNRDEFKKKKSKELANGVVGFRVGTPKAKTLKGFTWKAVLEVLKRSVFKEDYIRLKEDVDKQQMIMDFSTQKIDSEALASVGVQVVQDETFGYEPRLASEADAA